MEWRVLVVDDKAASDVKDVIEGNRAVALPDSISCVTCENFSIAIEYLKKERFDLVILDLKDDYAPEEDELAGEKVFAEIKNCRFIPVIFHTGFAYKVSDLNSPYVRVVTRSEWQVLRSTIKEVFDTQLPRLARHIEEEQRRFMWESAEKIWTDDLGQQNPTDLVYLLARRLANSLSGDVVRSFLTANGGGGSPRSEMIHAVEMYIYPPVVQHFLFGDVFKKYTATTAEYFVLLTPSCDHAQDKAEFLLFARCSNFSDSDEWTKIKNSLKANAEPSNTSVSALKDLMKDNNPKPRSQDRYKYLPGTSFLPDLLVDLQNTLTVPKNRLGSDGEVYERVASLDSPFAEHLQARMIRYFGRIGTPPLDTDLTYARLKASS